MTAKREAAGSRFSLGRRWFTVPASGPNHAPGGLFPHPPVPEARFGTGFAIEQATADQQPQ